MPLANNRKILLLEIILAVGVFITDLYTPRGIADGISYVALVLVTLLTHKNSHTIFAAFAATLLTIVGGFFSPDGDVGYIFIVNRSLAIIGIWAAALVVVRSKNSQAEGRRLRDRLNALFLHATEGIIITNSHGLIEMINPAAEKQFGYGSGELTGQGIEVLVPTHVATKHKKHRSDFNHATNNRQMGAGLDLSGKRKDNTEFPLEISLSRYTLDAEQYAVAFINDITERKKREQELKQSHEELQKYAAMLKETNEELESFAYISSHDLQEPLRKIQSFGSRIMMDPATKFSEASADYMTRVLNAAVRMQNLINDLLTFSRLTTRDKIRTQVDLTQVTNEVLADLEVLIEKNNAKVTVNGLSNIMAEPTQMRQLFQNLISNAIKFRSPDKDPAVNITGKNIRIYDKEYLEIKFEDNGIGFDEKYSDKIFGIFQRLNGSQHEGSGIGLTICKKIVTRHGGTIHANSKPGRGSFFTILLPITGNPFKQENHVTDIQLH